MRRDKRAHDTERQSGEPDQSQDERQTGKAVAFEIFALRHRHYVSTLAHFFGASGFGSGGFVSAGLSRSARCSSGTSASVAFWLRCNARRYAMIAQRSVTETLGP